MHEIFDIAILGIEEIGKKWRKTPGYSVPTALEQLEERRRRRLLRAEDHHVGQASVGVAPLGRRGERLERRRRARPGGASEEG